MPNTKSAIRRVRRVRIQSVVNKIRKSKFRQILKKISFLIEKRKKKEALKLLPNLNSILMKIAKTGVLNKKTASRNISRFTKKIYLLK